MEKTTHQKPWGRSLIPHGAFLHPVHATGAQWAGKTTPVRTPEQSFTSDDTSSNHHRGLVTDLPEDDRVSLG